MRGPKIIRAGEGKRTAKVLPCRPAKPKNRGFWIRSGLNGAGEGNRTLVFSLEGCCSTIELHPLDGGAYASTRCQWQDGMLCFGVGVPSRAKVVDSRNKSGHYSVGGIWVVGLGTLFGGVGLEAWVWGFCMGRSRVKAGSPSKRADSSKAVMTALVAVIHDLFSVLKKVNYSPLQSATARPS